MSNMTKKARGRTCTVDKETKVDDSIEADARRFRWLLDGNGYFMEEEGLCGHWWPDDKEQMEARATIDLAMAGKY